MVFIKSIILSVAFAAAVSAQSQISDGQIQVPTSAPAVVTPKPTVAPPLSTAVIASTGGTAPPVNGTFTSKTPAATSPAPYTGAANLLSWSKEMAVAGAAVAGLAML